MKIEESHWNFPHQSKNALIVDIHNRKAYILKDGQGNCHFAIETNYNSFSTIITEGLQVVFNQIDLDNRNGIPVIQFKCAHPAFLTLFVRILNEIISNSDEFDFENKTRSIINIWMRFLNKTRKAQMDDNLVLGLIGELLFIENLLSEGLDDSLILDSWTGPDQESKDFTFDVAYVEVKSSSKVSGHTHMINGIEQLNSFNRELYLNSFHFNKTDGKSSFSLNSVIDRLVQSHFEPIGLDIKFFDKLYDYGYDKRDSDFYEKIRIELVGEKFFFVDDSFPKITVNEFKTKLDSRISKLKYEIDLNSHPSVAFKKLKDVLH